MTLLTKRFFSALFVLFALSSGAFGQTWVPGTAQWEYNPGPDPATEMGRKVIDIYAELPEYMDMSAQLEDRQKFRYIFGLMMTRTYFNPNAVKILFIGQDATHIAEAAKQPGTSGFGARVQSIGNFFGVDQGVATTNEFMSTIKGQYAGASSVFVEKGAGGQLKINTTQFVDNNLWVLANGRDSEILIKREAFWEWMLKNNPESLQMIVTFGGAARDGFAEFLIARGAQVGTKIDPDRLKNISVPEMKLVNAGGNAEFPVPVTKDGKDIYAILLNNPRPDYSKPEVQKAAIDAVTKAGKKAIDMMVFTGGGLYGSGVVNAAQLGGYDLSKVTFNGKPIVSLKGLKLSDGTVITQDIAFASSVHPTVLSQMTPKAASEALKKSFAPLLNLKKLGWRIKPDLDDNGKPRHNSWDEGKDYAYGRADIRQGYFEFGAPDDRRVSKANASRLDPQTIIAGTRQGAKFDDKLIDAVKKSLPSDPKNPEDMWSDRPRQKDTRYIFDRGPGEDVAKAIMTSLDRNSIFEPKPGMKTLDKDGNDVTFETHGIDAYYTKTHPGTGFFGIHRGSFENSRALILADPQGLDDWDTARAMTGTRGQYLNGLMRDLGYGEQYLVIKTVPVGMDGATSDEWEVVRSRTEKYREAAIQMALSKSKIERIFTDGPIAQAEMQRILAKMGVKNIQVININRNPNDLSAGIVEAGQAAGARVSGKMADIPTSHLPWWARGWEGAGGDHVVDATGSGRGGVRALITPDWVAKQDVKPSPWVAQSIQKLRDKLDQMGLRIGTEPLKDFLARKGLGDGTFDRLDGTRKPKDELAEKRESKTDAISGAKCGGLARKISGK